MTGTGTRTGRGTGIRAKPGLGQVRVVCSRQPWGMAGLGPGTEPGQRRGGQAAAPSEPSQPHSKATLLSGTGHFTGR